MKHFILCALLTSLSLSSWKAEAQSVITRKQKVENSKPSAKPKTQKAKPAVSSKPKSHTSSVSSSVNLQSELNKLANSMVYVSGGTFMMGANSGDSDAEDDEKPRHQVHLSSFYICKYEVTQALWKAVMGSNPSYSKGVNLPVENVSWDDCQQFIKKLNSLTGQNYRLPTEAEWEFAARGGNSSRGYKYSGGDYIANVAWYDGDSGSKTHSVGTKSSNELGLYDMTGNVWEWCSDRYGSYDSRYQSNPAGPSCGSYRVCRGGSWLNITGDCRASHRRRYTPGFSGFHLGLRLARS